MIITFVPEIIAKTTFNIQRHELESDNPESMDS